MIDLNEIIRRSVLPFVDGAVLGISSHSTMMVINLYKPAKSEVRAILKGKVEVRLARFGETGIFVWKFTGKTKPPLFFDTPFHIGKVPLPLRGLPKPAPLHSFKIYLQNSRCELIGTRTVTLPKETSVRFETTVNEQKHHSYACDWSEAKHLKEVERFYDLNPEFNRLWLSLSSCQ